MPSESPSDLSIAVIVPAAGFSARWSPHRSKLDEDLGGRPVLQRTVELFTKRDEVGAIIVAGPHEDYEEFRERHGDKLSILGVVICRGGKRERWETVRAALEHVPEDSTHVAVHDAARPCAPPELLDRVFDAAGKYAAVIPAIDVPDTIKRVGDEPAPGAEADPIDAILGGAGAPSAGARAVAETVSRERLVLVQTPQVFEIDLIRRAYAQSDLTSTDDASLVEKLGETVVVVEGDPRNLKITLPRDLPLARAVLGVRGPQGRPTHKRF